MLDIRKKGDFQAPMVKCYFRLCLLCEAADLIESWSKSGRAGFTSLAALVWYQTLHGLANVAEDLLQNYDFEYVLLGKLQSDPIGGHFCCYRQMSGANFFTSLQQLLDSEEKIRVLNKLHLNSIFLDLEYKSMTDLASLQALANTSSPDVQWLVDALDATALHMDDIEEEALNIIFYVAGLIGRGISQTNKCTSCKSLLLEDKEIEVDHGKNKAKNVTVCLLLELADHDGLAAPTEFTFYLCTFSYMIFNQIGINSDLRKSFLSCKDHIAISVKAVSIVGTKHSDIGMNSFTSITCDKNHTAFGLILQKFFSCFIKNVLKNLNRE